MHCLSRAEVNFMIGSEQSSVLSINIKCHHSDIALLWLPERGWEWWCCMGIQTTHELPRNKISSYNILLYKRFLSVCLYRILVTERVREREREREEEHKSVHIFPLQLSTPLHGYCNGEGYIYLYFTRAKGYEPGNCSQLNLDFRWASVCVLLMLLAAEKKIWPGSFCTHLTAHSGGKKIKEMSFLEKVSLKKHFGYLLNKLFSLLAFN